MVTSIDSMAGIWKSPETSSTVDWVPLPEVKVNESRSWCSTREDTLSSGYNANITASYSSPILYKYPPVVEPAKTPVSNLTILSLGTSSNVQSTASKDAQPHPSSSAFINESSGNSTLPVTNPSYLDPAHLDELWKNFLQLVMSSGMARNKPGGCGCNCHMTIPQQPATQVDPPTGKPLVYDVSPPTSHRNAILSHSKDPHSQSNQTHSHDTPTKTSDNVEQGTRSNSFTPHSHVSKKTATIGTMTPCSKPVAAGYAPMPMYRPPMTDTSGMSSRLERLTLQEACCMMKKGFIANSQKRQEAIREKRAWQIRRQCNVHSEKRLLLRQPITELDPPTTRSVPPVHHFRPCSERPKLSMKEMYQQSKKNWGNLPEVREREEKGRREREAATNRLRAKLYEKEVLNRMRKMQRKKNEKHSKYMNCIKT